MFGRIGWKYAAAVRQRLSPAVQIETRYSDNVRFIANLKDHIETQIFWQGVQEGDRGKLALMLRELGPDNVLFDIGANVGAFTLAAAAQLPDGEVHAFEPWSTHLERLSANISLNGFSNIHVNPFALGKETGSAILHIIDPVNTGMATLYPEETGLIFSSIKQSQVSCQVLDDYVREKDITRLDMMKIDVEGAELNVLEGGRETLERFHPKLLMELNPGHLARAGATADSIFALLSKYGYSIARIEHDSKLTPLGGPEDLIQHQNVYCDAI
jgi:FkbM family methyltransferase